MKIDSAATGYRAGAHFRQLRKYIRLVIVILPCVRAQDGRNKILSEQKYDKLRAQHISIVCFRIYIRSRVRYFKFQNRRALRRIYAEISDYGDIPRVNYTRIS